MEYKTIDIQSDSINGGCQLSIGWPQKIYPVLFNDANLILDLLGKEAKEWIIDNHPQENSIEFVRSEKEVDAFIAAWKILNPPKKKMYISFAPQSSPRVVDLPENFHKYLEYCDEGDEWEVEIVFMTQADFEALPEHTGF